MALLAVGLLVGARLMGAARAAPQGSQSAELALRDRLAEAEGWGRQADKAAALDEAAALAAFELHQPQRAITLLRERLQRFPSAPGRAAALAQLAGLYATALRDPARAAATFEESARSDLRGAGPRWLAAAEAWEEAGSRAHAIEALEAAEADPACAFAAAVSLGRLLLDLDPDAALDASERALLAAADPDEEALAHLGRATAIERIQGPEAALIEVESALSAGLTDPALERRRDRLLRPRTR